jgi:hypothetical protein
MENQMKENKQVVQSLQMTIEDFDRANQVD